MSCVLRDRNSVSTTDRKASQKWLGLFLGGGGGMGLTASFREMFGPNFAFLSVHIKVFYKIKQLY